MEAPFFVRVNQVLVRLWAPPSQSLTGRFGVPAMAMVFRGDCCVLSKSDLLARSCAWSVRMAVAAEDGFCAWWRSRACPGDRDLEREKGIRWMPWHQEAMKDVARCEKPRGAASRR